MSFSASLKDRAKDVWEAGYQHPFVQGIGQGTLDKGAFKFYLLQDYLYLLEYSKVFALAAIKADREDWMTNCAKSQYFILANEMGVHRQYMESFGITPDEVRAVKPSLFNKAYTANMLSTGLTFGFAELIATVFPCAWTYCDYGKRLKAQYADTLEGNFYRSWIETYASDDFHDSFQWFYPALDTLAERMSDAERERIVDIFTSSVEFEYLFWDMAYKQQMSF